MNIYRLETAFLVAGGTANIVTHRIRGGLLRQFVLRTESTGTIFKANLLDTQSNSVLNYGWHQGEINDSGSTGALPIPLLGVYIIQIATATLSTTCSMNLLVEE